VEALSQLGIPNSALATTSDGQTIRVGAIDLEIQGGYDDSFDSKGRMNKFSLLATLGATTIWYSGDCHALPPALQGRRLDAVFCWSSPDVVAHLARITPPPKRFVIMHHDKHEPGMFWCSRDAAQDALALSRKLPGVEVLVPDRLGSFAAFASSR